MTAPTIRLATIEELRAITSVNVGEILRLPHLYIATDEPDVMRAWGVADADTLADYERLYPGALVAPVFSGERAGRGDLVYDGAEPAVDFIARASRA